MLSRRLVLGGLGAVALARPAFAHRLARTETEVRIDPDGTVGVVHVYHVQDAQVALYKAGLINRPDLGRLRARATLALYTDRNFTLSDATGPVALDIIGSEIEGDSIYVYQEGRVSRDGPGGPLTIDARMLRDLVHDQRNSVNVVRGGRTVTLDFSGEGGPKTVD